MWLLFSKIVRITHYSKNTHMRLIKLCNYIYIADVIICTLSVQSVRTLVCSVLASSRLESRKSRSFSGSLFLLLSSPDSHTLSHAISLSRRERELRDRNVLYLIYWMLILLNHWYIECLLIIHLVGVFTEKPSEWNTLFLRLQNIQKKKCDKYELIKKYLFDGHFL